jgi:fatty acid desaturase
MDHNYSQDQQQRHALLAVFLTVLGVLFFGVVLVLLSGGFFMYVVLLPAAIFLMGLLHYVLWGRAFTEEVAGEREEEQLRQRAQADLSLTHPHGIRRM